MIDTSPIKGVNKVDIAQKKFTNGVESGSHTYRQSTQHLKIEDCEGTQMVQPH